MEIQKALELLEYHNKWRKGADVPMVHPKDLSEAIDTIVLKYKE